MLEFGSFDTYIEILLSVKWFLWILFISHPRPHIFGEKWIHKEANKACVILFSNTIKNELTIAQSNGRDGFSVTTEAKNERPQ